jgi:hypothetical protein
MSGLLPASRCIYGNNSSVDPPYIACHTGSMSSPEQNPPGSKQLVLRATASGDTLDRLLVAFTAPAERKSLPGFLHLFGKKSYAHVIDDVFNGVSQKDRVLKAYQRHVTDQVRTKFGLYEKVRRYPTEKGSLPARLELGVNLGVEVARRLLAPPFFDDTEPDRTVLPMLYTIDHPVEGQDMVRALGDLREYLGERPRGVVDELAMVEEKFRDRPIILRSRVREYLEEDLIEVDTPELPQAS